MPLPPNALAELQRDMARLGFVVGQIREIEEARQKRLEQQPESGPHAMVRLLARVVGIGVETADMLVHELLSRDLRDRRAVARYAGLTGSPDESGARRREKGLAKAGNARVRLPRLGGHPRKVGVHQHGKGRWRRGSAAGSPPSTRPRRSGCGRGGGSRPCRASSPNASTPSGPGPGTSGTWWLAGCASSSATPWPSCSASGPASTPSPSLSSSPAETRIPG